MKSKKSRLVAFLLAFFLGFLGVHRFYVGRVSSGMVQLLLTCTIVGAIVSTIWAFIDMVTIAAGSFKDKEGAFIDSWNTSQVQ